MALIKCLECQREISDAAQFCPNCGFPISKIAKPETGEIIVVRRGFALAAIILATVYAVFAFLFCTGHAPVLMEGANVFADGFISAMNLHAVLVFIGVVFGWSGFFTKRRNQVLVSAILYCVAAVLFLIWALFLVLPIVFGFVGYARMKPKRVRLDEYILD